MKIELDISDENIEKMLKENPERILMLQDFETVAAMVKEKRKALGMTQKEVADAAGITASQMSKFENGRANPTYERVLDVVKAVTGGEALSLAA